MTTLTKTGAATGADVRAIAVAALLGTALLWTAGFANSSALHGAAHDTRHAYAFPCD